MLPDCDPTVLQCPRPRRQGSRVALWSWRECRKIVLSKASSTIAASRPSRQGHVSLQKRRPRIRWCRSCNWSPCRPHRRPFRSGPSGFLVWLNARIASLGNTSGIKSTWKIATREIFGISGSSEQRSNLGSRSRQRKILSDLFGLRQVSRNRCNRL